jgi:carbamoyl-phosphate synthase small subunit
MGELLKKPALLLLEDGTLYEGRAAGKIGTTAGEICFNTSMTGYQEVFTDPSYFGQILVATNVHIGNYGTRDEEIESDSIKIAGLVCKDFNVPYSRKQADQSIQDYFESENLVGISRVDTRSIVRHIRTKGAMNAIISSEILDVDELKEKLREVPSMEGLELASRVSTREPYTFGNPEATFRIAVMDYGVKKNILRNFAERDCFLKIFPAKTSWEEVKQFEPDGYFLSNGPGDPAPMDYAVSFTRKVLERDEPLFGICLGHQILALALDIPTYKMHHGHRGINHPVKNMITGKGEITSQNHGFGVSPGAIREHEDKVRVTHMNLNDNTIEGLQVIGKKAFSVQYHPESSPGPHDSRYLFEEFVSMLSERKEIASVS